MLDDLRECYRILDVEPGASLEVVKRSYRELVKVWHPDRFANDPSLQAKAQEKLKQINLAYERICKGEAAESNGRRAASATDSAGCQQQHGPSSSQDSQRQASENPPPPRPEHGQAGASQSRPAPQSGTVAQWSHAAFGFGLLALSLWLAPTFADDFSKYEAGEGIRTTRNTLLFYQLLGKQGVVVFFLLLGCFMGYFGLCHARALLSGQRLVRFGLRKGHMLAASVFLSFFVLTADRPQKREAQIHPAYNQSRPNYPDQPPPVVQSAPDDVKPAAKDVAVLKFKDFGEIVVEFYPEVAPGHVANFKNLANQKFYDGTQSRRLIPGFMIQLGDPLTKDPSKEAFWGTGDPGYKIKAEFNDRPHDKGVLSMARSASPDSAGSQFFICFKRVAHLDRQYTVFGKVLKGLDVLDKLEAVPVGGAKGSKPQHPVVLESVKIASR